MNQIPVSVAFIAGFLSFLNPCVLPLVPAFLGYLSGVSLTDTRRSQAKIFWHSFCFVLGFSCVFALVGVLLNTVLAGVSYAAKIWMARVGGVFIILFGLHLIGFFKIGFLEKGHQAVLRGISLPPYFFSFVFGAVFGVSWTPCAGAILGSVLLLSLSQPGSSFILLLAYALGMGLPFLLVGAFSSVASELIRRAEGFLKYFNRVIGVFLLVLGVLVFRGTGSVLTSQQIASQTLTAQTGSDLASRSRIALKEKRFPRAKEFKTPQGFINSVPFELKSFIGKKVILLDFWTYSCINCQRTLPYLKAWDERYRDQGLLIIGVHAPEFGFEKIYANVETAVRKAGISYPVILDNEHDNLELYDTIYWPTEFLIDIDGFIVEKNIGDGDYEKTEKRIQELLEERRQVLGQPQFLPDKSLSRPSDSVAVDFSLIGTPEIYLGAQKTRGNFGNAEGLIYDKTFEYDLPGSFEPNKVYVSGSWHNDADFLELRSRKGKIVLIYKAKVVNMVLGVSGKPVSLKIVLDGKPLTEKNRGRDVSASGVVSVAAYELYNIVLDDRYGSHRLEVDVEDPGLKAYTFTFG